MSASKEKRERSELRETGSYKKQNERLKQERKDKTRKTKTWVITICVVVLAIIVILFGSNILYNNMTALKSGNMTYKTADYNYFYTSLQQNYYGYYSETYGDNTDLFMPDDATLREETLALMKRVSMLTGAADEAGYTISQEGLDSIEAQRSYLEYYSESYGYDSVDSYLASNYGRGVTEELFIENMTKWVRADEYSLQLQDSYEYTDAELDAYYEQNSDTYDVISYRMYYFSGAATEADEENGIEAVDSETAMADAKAKAEAFVDRLESGDSFADAAYDAADESSKVYYEDEDATLVEYTRSYMADIYADWLYDDARVEGDHEVFEVEGSGYYVVEYVGRDDNSYQLVNVRHILVNPETVNSADYEGDDAGYEAALEEAKAAAETEAQAIYDEWLAGDATEESFAALADERSDDSSAGGLIENMSHGSTVAEFNDWSFDESRMPGDTEIVYSEAYGYHIMYFVGQGDPYNRYIARNMLASEAYSEWETERLANYEISKTAIMNIAEVLDVVK